MAIEGLFDMNVISGIDFIYSRERIRSIYLLFASKECHA